MVASSTFALAALAAASSAMAHMELSWPYAFKSKFNPANSGAANNIGKSRNQSHPLPTSDLPRSDREAGQRADSSFCIPFLHGTIADSFRLLDDQPARRQPVPLQGESATHPF